MKLFTFSGIKGNVSGRNVGADLITFAREIREDLPGTFQPDYLGRKDVDHFTSDINLGRILGNFESLFTLDGKYELDEEARVFGPEYAKTLIKTAGTDDLVLILAHSQGTNNLAHALDWIGKNQPAFIRDRTLRCILFDPKVGSVLVSKLIETHKKENLSFLFFQSENDLLDNQSILRSKFIDQLSDVGDHLWVRGLNHSSICEWESMGKEQSMLTRPKYLKFRADVRREKIRLTRQKGGIGPRELPKFSQFIKNYAMLDKSPSLAISGFLQGKLAGIYQS